MKRLWLVTGSLSMLLALAVAAASGHGDPAGFVPSGRQVLDTAREMHVAHSLALLLLGAMSGKDRHERDMAIAGGAFILGIIFFPGGIYASRLLGIDALRPLIPVGGLAFMAGWAILAFTFLRRPDTAR